ncbi:MAG: hypothetical protein WKG01_12195 [Kofleriaceae bacterium]
MSRTTLATVVAILICDAQASADPTSWHGTIAGDVAATDNVFAAPSTGDREVDVFFTVRPGLLFSYAHPRTLHDLTAEVEVIEYVRHSDEPSLSARFGWRGFYLVGPRTQVLTQVNAQNGILAAIASRNNAAETLPELIPVNKVNVYQADASEYLSYVATRELTLSQTLFARASYTDDNLDDPTTVASAEAGFGLGIDRQFRTDSLSLELGGSVVHMERIAPEGALQGSRRDRQLTPRIRAQWRHDFDRRLSASADAGLVYVRPFGTDPYNPDSETRSGTFPIVGANVSYSEVWGRAGLQARRDVTPNLLVAQNTVNDSVTASVVMPLPWLDDSRRRAPKLIGLGSVGIQRTQLIDSETGDLTSNFTSARLDLGVAYTPRAGVVYGARYELTYQTGDAEAVMTIPGYYRNTIYFTYSIQYPDRSGPEAPRRKSGNAVRADRKDLVPLGAEPVVPDIIEQGSEDEEGQR